MSIIIPGSLDRIPRESIGLKDRFPGKFVQICQNNDEIEIRCQMDLHMFYTFEVFYTHYQSIRTGLTYREIFKNLCLEIRQNLSSKFSKKMFYRFQVCPISNTSSLLKWVAHRQCRGNQNSKASNVCKLNPKACVHMIVYRTVIHSTISTFVFVEFC